MHKVEEKLLFSPSDLTSFMESKFVSYMERLLLNGDPRAIRDEPDESMDLIRERGLAHESAYLLALKNDGFDVCEISEGDKREGLVSTLEAIKAGRQAIYQAHLSLGDFFGKCDFLLRIDDRPSEILQTKYSYVPYDTKLASKPKPYFAIQLCAYAEMLAEIQGFLPDHFVIVLGDGSLKSFRTEDHFYYYRQLKSQFVEFHEQFDPSDFVDDVSLPAFCIWKTVGKKLLEERDDLSRVANIRKSQIVKLKAAGINTLTDLARSSLNSVPKMSKETFATLRNQASLQLDSIGLEKPLHKQLPIKPEIPRRGFALLPPASHGDIFFDMEGYPHVEGGLEYLFGASYIENGELQFFERWAHSEVEERLSFEGFIDWAFARFQNDPNMHIYHYGHYEQNALRRLMGKFGTREYEIDQLLRHERFVDLLKIVKQGLLIGEPGYSLKNVEHLYRGKREGEVSSAMDSVVWYYKWREHKEVDVQEADKLLDAIRHYNKEDCDSTYHLSIWLYEMQKRFGIKYLPPPPPILDELKDNVPEEKLASEVLTSCGNGVVPTVLSQLILFHKREEKPVWWNVFDKRTWLADELYEDQECLQGLEGTNRWGEKLAKSHAFEFRFDPEQETKIEVGDTVCFYLEDGNHKTLTVREFDEDNGRILLSSSKLTPYKNIDIVLKELTGIKTISDSIADLASRYAKGATLPPAIVQFLERRSPRLRGNQEGQPIIANPDLDLVPQVVDVIKRMQSSTLCIQGPPGSGKTYTAAQAILALLADGKRVGVTSNSHKAIENVLNAIGAEARKRNTNLAGVKIGKDKRDEEPPRFTHPGIAYNKDAAGVFGSYRLYGGTAYAFSNTDAINALDYLFVDEAGQVSIANLVGMCRAANNIVLLGDQMQLEQPVRGHHPGDSGLSTLQYYSKGHAAIPNHMGVFLSSTRRLHPNLCSFISSAIYEGRLNSIPETSQRRLLNPHPKSINKEAGLLFVPVPHVGCVQASEDEIERIKELILELKDCQLMSGSQQITIVPQRDILMVAPYNKQVRLLKKAFPGIEIGTVDKFQGKEKPIVIVSMADSDSSESSRGMEFLFSKNRFNVAISRAQILAIVVANPLLAYADCHTLKSMSLVNLFSRISQIGVN
jgi:uncharacterized protein